MISGWCWVSSLISNLTRADWVWCRQALFNNGDRCGYVLKPTSRLANRPFIPAQQQKKYSHYHWTLNLQVRRRRTRPTSSLVSHTVATALRPLGSVHTVRRQNVTPRFALFG
jgi:hypothetical protein